MKVSGVYDLLERDYALTSVYAIIIIVRVKSILCISYEGHRHKANALQI